MALLAARERGRFLPSEGDPTPSVLIFGDEAGDEDALERLAKGFVGTGGIGMDGVACPFALTLDERERPPALGDGRRGTGVRGVATSTAT